MSLTWTTPAWMWPLLLVLAAGAVIWTVYVYRRTRPAPGAGLGRLLIILRSAALLLLVIALAGPVLSRLFRQDEPSRLVVVLEDSSSMAIADSSTASDRSDGPSTRWDSALAFAAKIDSSLRAMDWPGQLVFLRGNGLNPLQEFHLDDPVISDPDHHGTDLNQLLRQAADQTVGLPVRGVVLLSDGQETRGVGPSGRTDRPTARGQQSGASQGDARLLVVGAGDPVGSADRLIKDLRYPDTAYSGDEIVVELAVTHRFLDNGPLTPVKVTLSEDGNPLLEKTFPLDRETTHLEIPFEAPEEGLRVFELQVSALDNERFLANNQVSLAVNVRPGRSRVLALTNSPGWDLRFLAQAALAEARIELSVVYPSAKGPVFADSLVSWKEPADPAGWNQWDGVVLLGWQGLTGSVNWTNLEKAVSDGLGLLVLPANSSVDQRTVVAPPSGLSRLLPVSAEQYRWVEGPFFGSIPTGSAGHPILHLVGQGDLLDDLNGGPGPGLSGLPPLRKIIGVLSRPGALNLVEGVQKGGGPAGARLPLLSLSNQVRGRVIWFGGQRLWELAFWEPGLGSPGQKEGAPQAARRLLQNILVWLAAGHEESGLVFAGRRPFYQEGERITLGAQWRDMRGQPVLDRELSLILRTRDAGSQVESERTFALRSNPERPQLVEVDLPPLPPGNYSIQLLGQGDPPVLGREEFLVVTSHSIEETQVRQDQRRLSQLAKQAGGSYHALNSDQTLAAVQAELAQLDWAGSSHQRRTRLDFWSGWPFLVVVVALLAWEWFLRRRNGLL